MLGRGAKVVGHMEQGNNAGFRNLRRELFWLNESIDQSDVTAASDEWQTGVGLVIEQHRHQIEGSSS